MDDFHKALSRGLAVELTWELGEQITPENFSTAKPCTGGNSLYLMSRAIRDGRGDHRWGTYNQIREAGGQVRKGENGTQVLFFTDRTARAVKDEQGKVLKDQDGKTIRSRPCTPTTPRVPYRGSPFAPCKAAGRSLGKSPAGGGVDGIAMVIHMTRHEGNRFVEEALFVQGYEARENRWLIQPV